MCYTQSFSFYLLHLNTKTCVDIKLYVFMQSYTSLHISISLCDSCCEKKRKVWSNLSCHSNVTQVQNPRHYISACFKALPCDWGRHLLRTCSCCVLCWSLSCASLHIFSPIMARQQAAQRDQRLYTYTMSDPLWSRLSVWSWILSLTQTAALLQSSVVHFVVAVKSFPSTVALFILFSVFPQRK